MIEYEVIKLEVHDYDVTETGQRSQNLKTIEEARKVVLEDKIMGRGQYVIVEVNNNSRPINRRIIEMK